MELILLQNVRNLGELGEQVHVKSGYGRNFLLPQGIGMPATAANKAYFESRKTELLAAAGERKQLALARAKDLDGRSITVAMRASDEGKLYGSVGPHEIADKVSEEGFELDAEEVTLIEGPIRAVGYHKVLLQLHAGVEVNITVVVAQQTNMGVNMPVSEEEALAAIEAEEAAELETSELADDDAIPSGEMEILAADETQTTAAVEESDEADKTA